MRGFSDSSLSLPVSIVLEDSVPAAHPLRSIKALALAALDSMDDRFSQLYSRHGRPSIPPEVTFLSLLVQVLYAIRSERQLVEQLQYNLLFKWFVGLDIDEKVFDSTVFTKNRDRLFNSNLVGEFLDSLMSLKEVKRLLSNDHFSVDGTLIEAWASHKSFHPKDSDSSDNDGGDFRGEKRSNETHESKTDPDSRLFKKSSGSGAKLCYMGNVMIENRHGLVVDANVHHASGTAERDGAKEMLSKHKKRLGNKKRITVAADKLYDTRGFVDDCREMGITPHVSQNDKRRGGSAIDGRTTRHDGYKISATKRKMVECPFGFGKQHGTMRKTKKRGITYVAAGFIMNLIGYNIVRAVNIFEHSEISQKNVLKMA